DFAISLEPVGFHDLAGLRPGFFHPCPGVAFGSEGTVAFGALGLQPARIHFRYFGGGSRLPMSLACLFPHDLRGLALLDQAGFQQLVLQRVAHRHQWLPAAVPTPPAAASHWRRADSMASIPRTAAFGSICDIVSCSLCSTCITFGMVAGGFPA